MKKWTCFSSCANFEQTNEMDGFDFHKAKRLDCELKIQSLRNPFSLQVAIALNSSLKAKCNHKIFLIFCRNLGNPNKVAHLRSCCHPCEAVGYAAPITMHILNPLPSVALGPHVKLPLCCVGHNRNDMKGREKKTKTAKNPIQNHQYKIQHIIPNTFSNT